ncbi:hypothetical protein GEMRC1_012301 [Eukaryota sp. GEM-RC1]
MELAAIHDLVGLPVLAAASLVIEHSSLFEPVGAAITNVFAIFREIKFNKTKSDVLAARLLRLTKVAFFPSKLSLISQTPPSITHCLQQYNDSKWFKRTFSRAKFKEEFEECNDLLDNFSSELSLAFNGVTLEKLSALSSTTIDAINTRDEEDFQSAKAAHSQSVVNQMTVKYSELMKKLDETIQTSQKLQLRNQLDNVSKQKTEFEKQISESQNQDNIEATIDAEDLELEWESSIHSGQSEVVFAVYVLADVIVKLYPGNNCISAELAKEYRLLMSLPNEPSVPRIFGIAKVFKMGRPRFGLVMERLSNETLKNKITGIKNVNQKLDILIQLAKTLATCHEAHYLHRDLKPDNILFRSRVPVIIDWGSGKNIGSDNMSLSLAGNRVITPSWTSPELASGKSVYSDRIDVFSFGLIIIYVLTGQSIWEQVLNNEQRDQVIINKLSSGDIPAVPYHSSLPMCLYPLLCQCLLYDYALRPDMSEVLSVLVAYRKKTPLIECLSYENLPLCNYALSSIDSDYISNADSQLRRDLYSKFLDLLFHCYSEDLSSRYFGVMNLIEDTDNLSGDLIEEKRRVKDLLKQKFEAQSSVPVLNLNNLTPGEIDISPAGNVFGNRQSKAPHHQSLLTHIQNQKKAAVDLSKLSPVMRKILQDLRNVPVSKIDMYVYSSKFGGNTNGHVGSEGAIALADALKVNSTVTQIKLQRNSIGTEGAIALADALKVNSTVVRICLKRNSICIEGAIALADALKVNSTVTWIHLQHNAIGIEVAIALAEALKVNSTVTDINLANNAIGTEGAIALTEALKVNSTVIRINLGVNSIDSKTVQLIKRISNNRINL